MTKTKKARRQIEVRSPRKPKGSGSERRVEILQAAKELFTQEGYASVTTRAIAERVGLSQTGLYIYFSTKEDILRSIGDETHDAITAKFDEAMARAKSPSDALRRLVRAYIDYGLSHPAEYQLTFTVSPEALGPIAKDFSRPIESQEAGARSFLRFRDHLATLVKQGLPLRLDPMLATQILWFIGHGTVSLLISRSHFPWANRARLLRGLENVIVNGLEMPAPPK